MDLSGEWPKPGWPWELEIPCILLALAALLVPLMLPDYAPPVLAEDIPMVESARLARQVDWRESWREQKDLTWGICIVAFYGLFHLLARGSHKRVSTPLVHLFAPIILTYILYGRLMDRVAPGSPGQPLVQGSATSLLIILLAGLGFGFVVARVRMAKYMLRVRDLAWDVNTPTVIDRTYFSLIVCLWPVFYPPRTYRTFTEGILVEGWLYVTPIPFSALKSVERVLKGAALSRGYFLATSRNRLVRLQLKDHAKPFYLSPRNAAYFVTYCQRHLASLRPEVTHPRPLVGPTKLRR